MDDVDSTRLLHDLSIPEIGICLIFVLILGPFYTYKALTKLKQIKNPYRNFMYSTISIWILYILIISIISHGVFLTLMVLDTLLLGNNHTLYMVSDTIAYFEWLCLDTIVVLQMIEFVILEMSITLKTGELPYQIEMILS